MRRYLFYFAVAGVCWLAPIIEASAASSSGAVDILVRKTEADSMKLGSPGQEIVVESGPTIKTKTTACDGISASYPIQSVLVVDPDNTYITGVIVCAPDGLAPGERLSPSLSFTDAYNDGSVEYVKSEATVLSSSSVSIGVQEAPFRKAPQALSREHKAPRSRTSSVESMELLPPKISETGQPEVRSRKAQLQTEASFSVGEQTQRLFSLSSWLFTLVGIVALPLCVLLTLRLRRKRAPLGPDGVQRIEGEGRAA